MIGPLLGAMDCLCFPTLNSVYHVLLGPPVGADAAPQDPLFPGHHGVVTYEGARRPVRPPEDYVCR